MKYLNASKLQLYHRFKEAHPGVKVSRSAFYRRFPKHYKKPSKSTDLCNICEAGKREETKLRSMERQQNGSRVSDAQQEAYKRLQRRVDSYRFHKLVANTQRECYTSEVMARTHYWCT